MVEDEDILNVTLDVLQFTEELKKSPLQNVDSFIMCFFSLDSPYISSRFNFNNSIVWTGVKLLHPPAVITLYVPA